jgi:hypothetical protein
MTAPSQLMARDGDGRRPCIAPEVLAQVVISAARRAAADPEGPDRGAWRWLRRALEAARGGAR